MKTNYIEQMSVADRNNSLSGYYNSLIVKYNKYFGEAIHPLSSKSDDDICCKVIKSGYLSFAAVLQRKKGEPDDKREADKDLAEQGAYSAEEYAAKKFALSKHLNLIEKVIYKLCYGSIDSSVTEENADIESVKQAMTWLFVDCVNSQQPSYQDVERVKMIFNMSSIVDKVGELSYAGEMVSGTKLSQCCIELLNSQVSTNHTMRTTADISCVAAYKEVVRQTINDMFRVLSNLLNFSQYLAVVEETIYPNMMPNSTFQTLEELKQKPNMERILELAEGVKTLLIEFFSSFVKIKSISLPHSYLSNAQLSHSTITNGNFMSSDIRGANLSFASARDCDFSMCGMDDISASHADFSGCNFNYSSLVGADLTNAVLNNTALNSIALLDRRILQHSLYTKQNSSVGSQISYAKADKVIKALFARFDGNPDDDMPNLRGSIVQKLSRHYMGEGSLSGLLEQPYNETEHSFPCFVMDDRGCVLDKLHEKVVAELENYDTWCGAQFPHPVCLEWASDKANTGNAIRLAPADLASASVKNAVMPDCALSIINLKNASFQNTDLNNSTYYYTNARGAFFGDCNMTETKAGYSDFYNATFNNSNLINSLFINCRLSETNFSKALLIDSMIINTSDELLLKKIAKESSVESETKEKMLSESDLAAVESKFVGNAVVAAADLQDSDFSYCIANNLSLVGINMDRSIFNGANLKRAFIYNCLSRWTDYTATNLSYALVIGNAFGHSSLPDANFTSARIFGCHFSDCDMRNINMINTRVDNTIFANCDMDQSNFSNTEFVNCRFENLNMNGANFTNCAFINCEFNAVSLENHRNLNTAGFTCCNIVDKGTYKALSELMKEFGLSNDYLKNCETPDMK